MEPALTPKASILIPAYNAEAFVTQAIESALEQGPEVEVIVVDDGSSDGTVEKIRAFEGRIQWETGPNRGAPCARNRALSLARAPWVQYLDADDYLMPGKVTAQLSVVDAQPEVDVLYGRETIEWHGHGEIRQTWSPIRAPRDPWALLAGWQLPQTGGPLWRRQALLDVGGWTPDQPCCQEHELYLRLLLAGKVFAYDEAAKGAIYRRFDTGTLSTKNPAQVRTERAKIENRLEAHLDSIGAMTPDRQHAVDQARFEMARSAWPRDRAEARRYHDAIRSQRFMPTEPAAPAAYRTIYKVGGFEMAERIAALLRQLKGAK